MNTGAMSAAAYYDETTPLYLSHVGDVLQGAMLSGCPDDMAPARTLDFVAGEAQMMDGQRVLDAGCGVCGPAIYFARVFPRMEITAVTVSPIQRHEGQSRIDAAGVGHRIRIVEADMHDLGEREAYDRVLFLESSGHSTDTSALWSMAWNALKPGGLMYVKDVMTFSTAEAMSPAQIGDLRVFNAIYAYQTYPAGRAVKEIETAGFREVAVSPLSPAMDSSRAERCKRTGGALNAFGRRHAHHLPNLPCAFFQISARK